MQLIICEKPKVAEKVASALSGNNYQKLKDGQINYYEFTHNNKHINVVSAVGHLYTLSEIKQAPWMSYPIFDIEWKPAYEVTKYSDYTKKYLKTIEKLAKKAGEIINSCDFDIEGSLIGYNVIRYACGINAEKAFRMKFSALTSKELVSAYENRFPLDLPNSYAGEARHIMDWYYGINLSRALMSSLSKCKVSKVLSIGRVQGPTLALLVKREKQIMSFVSKQYWELWAKHDNLVFMHVKARFFDNNEVKRILKKVRDGSSEITELKISVKKLQPPAPFDLTSLQVEAHNSFKMLPSLTLKVSQNLYENSLISYPRTSSQKLPPQIDIKTILKNLSKQKKYSTYANTLLSKGMVVPHNGKKDDPAHPAIHPTGILPSSKLGAMETKLYDLIVSRFLACLGAPADRETWTAVLIAEDEKFTAKGTHTKTMGWLEYYKYAKLEQTPPPKISKGKVLPEFGTTKKATKPPNRYTQASLVSELEKKKLGTKATRAVVVDTLFKREYVEGKSIMVKPLGIAIYDALEPFCPELMDEKLTRYFENEMSRIEKSPADKSEKLMKKVIKEARCSVEKISQKFKKHDFEIGKKLAQAVRKANVIGKCPVCGSDLVIRVSRASHKQFIGCTGYPKCTMSYPLPQNVKVTPTNETCQTCGAPIVKIKRSSRGRFTKEYKICVNMSCPAKTMAQTMAQAKAKTMEKTTAQTIEKTKPVANVQEHNVQEHNVQEHNVQEHNVQEQDNKIKEPQQIIKPKKVIKEPQQKIKPKKSSKKRSKKSSKKPQQKTKPKKPSKKLQQRTKQPTKPKKPRKKRSRKT